jgi:hypothetical protein
MYYSIHTPYNSTYNLIDENNQIYIGGSNYYCISVGLKGNGDDLFIDSKKECVLYNKFPTIQIGKDMMFALIYYLKKTYKMCNFEFNDKSSNKKVGSLPVYYLAFTRKTWYETEFNAYIKDNDTRNLYKETQNNFNSINFKNNITNKVNVLLENYNEIFKIYKNVNTNTIREFFDIIKNKIENKVIDYTTQVLPWLENFIKVQMGFDFIFNDNIKWVIDCNQEIKGDYILTELKKNPLPKYKNRYLSIKKKEFYDLQYGGSKKLTEREKELYKDPGWIGWKKYSISEFNPKDKKYLKKLLKQISR